MDHREFVEQLDAALDGELDPARQAAFDEHLRGCRDCAARHERARAAMAAFRAGAAYHRAPAALQTRIGRELRVAVAGGAPAAARPERAPGAGRRLVAALAAALIVAVVATDLALRLGAVGEGGLAGQVVDGHVRSLMEHHLSDVVSTDQHTVKPWFNGRLDFSPPVTDFASAGFPLIGGRLDYLDGHPVAALVYKRRLHVINLFLWPDRASGSDESAPLTRRGYQVLHGRAAGFAYWAVSDLNAAELREFARHFRDGLETPPAAHPGP
jgi:anti-sigma factor RsiW